jgi:hypothetical protein
MMAPSSEDHRFKANNQPQQRVTALEMKQTSEKRIFLV